MTKAAEPGDGVVEIFTDGACSGNPGPGGWGAVLRYNAHERELKGFANPTTNNRMEMMAAIAGSKDIRAMSRTSAPMRWRAPASRKRAGSCRGRPDGTTCARGVLRGRGRRAVL
jgi:hypothetical protein